MSAFLTKLWLILRSRLRSQARLEAENLVLRRQVLILSLMGWTAPCFDCWW